MESDEDILFMNCIVPYGIFKSGDIVKTIKVERLRCIGHVMRREDSEIIM